MSNLSELFRKATIEEPAAQSDAAGMDDEIDSCYDGHFTLLFVDDEPGVLKALRRIFLDENYRILLADGAEEALEVLGRESVHLIISDHRMPGKTGAQLLKEIKEHWPETIRIMLTGYADVQSIMGAVNEGSVYKFITKPWNDEDLRLTVSLALQQYVLLQENRKLRDLTKKQKAKLGNLSSLQENNQVAMGNILVRSGGLTDESLAMAQQNRHGSEFLGDTLVRLNLLSESKVIKILQDKLRIEFIDLREADLRPEVIRFLPRELCEKSRILPFRLTSRQLTLAMADPSDLLKCDQIASMTGLKVVPLLTRSSDILAQLKLVYGEGADSLETEDFESLEPMDEIDIVLDEEEEDVNLEELIGSSEVPPIIRIVNAVISEAIRYRASDIHIEPKNKCTLVRLRIDGMLRTKIRIPSNLHAATISRIKIISRLDISERRLPQDGRITVKSGTRMVDLRVSTMPTINGEKVVMRILDKSAAVKRIAELGVLPDDLKKVDALIRRPQGIIISTGPTGSGKTTSLYSLLGEMLQDTKNYETIEDPVEYFLEEANQVYVREQVGLTFAKVLRATLRQDPDVILVGEVRDKETADVAFKAALTGHTVLTSLHTNDAVSTVTRLIDLGIQPYLIASAVEGILAQRLVRKLCRFCRIESEPDPKVLDLLSLTSFAAISYVARGCTRCQNSGYSGRIGIFEVFVMSEDFRHLISDGYREALLTKLARQAGMRSLLEDGLEKVALGETTLEEILRVIGPQIKTERICHGCDSRIEMKFLFCPHCGAFKRNCCRNCQAPMEEDWNACVQCGTLAEKGEMHGRQITTG